MLLRSQNVHFDGLRLDDVVFIEESMDEEMASTRVEPKDVLLNITGASIGRCTVAPDGMASANVNQHVCILRPDVDRVTPQFLNLVLQSSEIQTAIFSGENGSSREGLNFGQIGDLEIVLPSIDRQKIIAISTSNSIENLESLILEKRSFLNLLAEKRRAFIARVILQGLKPRASLRDSGVPFLGAVPTHWDVWRIGHFAKVGNGSTPFRDNLDYWVGGTIPWLNSAATNDAEITEAKQFVTTTAVEECNLPLVPAGSVLVAITGQGKTRGQAALLTFPTTINQHIAYIAPDTSVVSADFLRLWFAAQYDFLRAMSDDMGGTKGALSCEQITNLRIAVPPIAEQRVITSRIQTEIEKIDNFLKATERTIALLQERRSALISAAVTGQLIKEESHAGA